MSDNSEKRQQTAAEEEVWIAISAFEQILEAMPNDRASLEALSHAYGQIGDLTRAKEYLLRLAKVVLDEGDADAAALLVRQLAPHAEQDPAVAKVRENLTARFAATRGDMTDASDELLDLGIDEQSAEPRFEAFNLADELSFAWALLEGNHVSQEEYANLVQDLTDMSSGDGSATVSVLHALEFRAFKNLERLMLAVSKENGAPIVSLGMFDIQPSALTALPFDFMLRRGAVVFDSIGNEALVVVMNPGDQKLRKSVASIVGRPCHFFMCLPSEFDRVMNRAREAQAKSAGSPAV
ncbi:MAG: hypothetical protein K8T26_11975 [Lentisphaerae bacterium]|nr:hypothetical protein [Lentisphaerota bacterium]